MDGRSDENEGDPIDSALRRALRRLADGVDSTLQSENPDANTPAVNDPTADNSMADNSTADNSTATSWRRRQYKAAGRRLDQRDGVHGAASEVKSLFVRCVFGTRREREEHSTREHPVEGEPMTRRDPGLSEDEPFRDDAVPRDVFGEEEPFHRGGGPDVPL